ncbi:hypothetical protein MYD50_003414 [Vibrio parahaemolyticus]|nr:hypothetical protein [Vibrio parahaemolyticus]EGR3062775.1 hypothetical protein [Vibrio parahaemolyticus]EGR3174414.1 hypothetical protein [Vibrio parahaemolyticus]EJC7022086.1 hypothetical protein [Vibrio parahaemolyticus]EJG0422911.1 hypothetical protein [Vibrio parahaemolyticus]
MPIIKKTAKELIELGLHYKVEPSCITKQIRDVTALAVWSYLLSHSESWEVTQKDVKEHFGLSRDKTRATFNLLMDMGLLVKRKKKDKQGKILGDFYDCYALPKEYEASACISGRGEDEKSPAPEYQAVDFEKENLEETVTCAPEPEYQAVDGQKVTQRLKPSACISVRGEDEKSPAPEYQAVDFEKENLEETVTCAPEPEYQAVDGQKVTQRLHIRPSNKRSILDQNNKPRGDFLNDFVSGQHAYRDEQNKHDYSNPHPSVPSEVLSPAEIQYFKMGQLPIRFQNGDFTDEQIQEIKNKNGIV